MSRFEAKDPEEVPAVQQYLNAQDDLDAFKAKYQSVFETFEHLVAQRNALLEAADKAVRGKEITCGPFTLISKAVKYDAERLYEALGREEFLAAGGTFETITRYGVDKSKFESRAAQGQIPSSVVEDVRTTELRYKKPDPFKL